MAQYVRGLLLVLLCGLAGYLGPAIFLGQSASLSYLGVALSSAAGAGALYFLAEMASPHVPVRLQGLAGAGAAVFTWLPVTLIAVFQIIPHLAQGGFVPFDIVWIASGFAPVVLLVATALMAQGALFGHQRALALMRALYRYSIPLLGIQVTTRLLVPEKQHRWLALFAAMLFLTLELMARLRRHREADHVSMD